MLAVPDNSLLCVCAGGRGGEGGGVEVNQSLLMVEQGIPKI